MDGSRVVPGMLHKSTLAEMDQPLDEGDTTMGSQTFIPRDHDVFAGLNVDEKSISVTLQ